MSLVKETSASIPVVVAEEAPSDGTQPQARRKPVIETDSLGAVPANHRAAPVRVAIALHAPEGVGGVASSRGAAAAPRGIIARIIVVGRPELTFRPGVDDPVKMADRIIRSELYRQYLQRNFGSDFSVVEEHATAAIAAGLRNNGEQLTPYAALAPLRGGRIGNERRIRDGIRKADEEVLDQLRKEGLSTADALSAQTAANSAAAQASSGWRREATALARLRAAETGEELAQEGLAGKVEYAKPERRAFAVQAFAEESSAAANTIERIADEEAIATGQRRKAREASAREQNLATRARANRENGAAGDTDKA